MNPMDETERRRRNDAIYTDHNSRAVTRWLEKKVIETCRQRMRETVKTLQKG